MRNPINGVAFSLKLEKEWVINGLLMGYQKRQESLMEYSLS